MPHFLNDVGRQLTAIILPSRQIVSTDAYKVYSEPKCND